jgi:hypothetical protein
MRSTRSVGGHTGQIDEGAPAGQAPLLDQALTVLVQDDHRRLLVIQSALINVLDAQIETLRTEMSRCLMEWDADEPPPKAAWMPRTCIRAMTLLDTIFGVGQRGAER